ncbi:DNA-DIRECTED RNA polymerase SUBUNIT ALPHA [Salix purpurea]|uniref:DNA-DIRECTED RNA polymerase SUBUNIT ALPHA n=2 Tax=Salix purpurea TaxID=77065 RepID=A0A9Q0ZRV4_SALPP|nr:DNA-DIRECTED RNA polymerase SUBUNIT ALPHA [Salix purpurea]
MLAPIDVFKIQYQQSRHKQQQFLTLRLHTFPVNMMAYIPPHMRRSKDMRRASPIPETLQPQFQRNINLRASTSHKKKSAKIVYADHAVSKWFAVGLDDDDQFPTYIHLEPISLEYVERKSEEKPLVLVNSIVTEEDCKLERNCSKSPWEIIAENVHQELLSSFEILRKEMDDQGSEKVKPILVARLGKFLFHGKPSMRLQSVNKIQVEEAILRQLNRSLYANIPSSYMENIIDGVVPAIGVDFLEKKDVYTVKLSDNTRPDATVLCKCNVLENKKLRLYKVELNQVRHMVIDVSCLDKNLDLRLMLCSRKILTALTDDEMNSLRDLISSAVVDPDMKGGLKWPKKGKASSGGRYRVIGVWHTITKAYRSSSFRLKARDADRYDFRTGTAETTREVYLKLKGIVSEIQEPGAESDSISKMLEDSLRLIWDKFLCCERFLT